MPKDMKQLTQIISQMKKPNHLNAIHAAAFVLPQSVVRNLAGGDLDRVKSVLRQLTERGRDPIVIVTKLDQVLMEREGHGIAIEALGAASSLRRMAASLLDLPLDSVFCTINYNSQRYESSGKRVPELDTQALKIMKTLVERCHQFLNVDPSMLAMKTGGQSKTLTHNTSASGLPSSGQNSSAGNLKDVLKTQSVSGSSKKDATTIPVEESAAPPQKGLAFASLFAQIGPNTSEAGDSIKSKEETSHVDKPKENMSHNDKSEEETMHEDKPNGDGEREQDKEEQLQIDMSVAKSTQATVETAKEIKETVEESSQVAPVEATAESIQGRKLQDKEEEVLPPAEQAAVKDKPKEEPKEEPKEAPIAEPVKEEETKVEPVKQATAAHAIDKEPSLALEEIKLGTNPEIKGESSSLHASNGTAAILEPKQATDLAPSVVVPEAAPVSLETKQDESVSLKEPESAVVAETAKLVPSEKEAESPLEQTSESVVNATPVPAVIQVEKLEEVAPANAAERAADAQAPIQTASVVAPSMSESLVESPPFPAVTSDEEPKTDFVVTAAAPEPLSDGPKIDVTNSSQDATLSNQESTDPASVVTTTVTTTPITTPSVPSILTAQAVSEKSADIVPTPSSPTSTKPAKSQKRASFDSRRKRSSASIPAASPKKPSKFDMEGGFEEGDIVEFGEPAFDHVQNVEAIPRKKSIVSEKDPKIFSRSGSASKLTLNPEAVPASSGKQKQASMEVLHDKHSRDALKASKDSVHSSNISKSSLQPAKSLTGVVALETKLPALENVLENKAASKEILSAAEPVKQIIAIEPVQTDTYPQGPVSIQKESKKEPAQQEIAAVKDVAKQVDIAAPAVEVPKKTVPKVEEPLRKEEAPLQPASTKGESAPPEAPVKIEQVPPAVAPQLESKQAADFQVDVKQVVLVEDKVTVAAQVKSKSTETPKEGTAAAAAQEGKTEAKSPTKTGKKSKKEKSSVPVTPVKEAPVSPTTKEEPSEVKAIEQSLVVTKDDAAAVKGHESTSPVSEAIEKKAQDISAPLAVKDEPSAVTTSIRADVLETPVATAGLATAVEQPAPEVAPTASGSTSMETKESLAPAPVSAPEVTKEELKKKEVKTDEPKQDDIKKQEPKSEITTPVVTKKKGLWGLKESQKVKNEVKKLEEKPPTSPVAQAPVISSLASSSNSPATRQSSKKFPVESAALPTTTTSTTTTPSSSLPQQLQPSESPVATTSLSSIRTVPVVAQLQTPGEPTSSSSSSLPASSPSNAPGSPIAPQPKPQEPVPANIVLRLSTLESSYVQIALDSGDLRKNVYKSLESLKILYSTVQQDNEELKSKVREVQANAGYVLSGSFCMLIPAQCRAYHRQQVTKTAQDGLVRLPRTDAAIGYFMILKVGPLAHIIHSRRIH